MDALACTVDAERKFILILKLKNPKRAAYHRVRSVMGASLNCRKNGEVYVHISRRDAERLLGAKAQFSCQIGAGNSTRARDFRAQLRPKRFVPKSLSTAVSRIRFDNDPKFLVAKDSLHIDCDLRFGKTERKVNEKRPRGE